MKTSRLQHPRSPRPERWLGRGGRGLECRRGGPTRWCALVGFVVLVAACRSGGPAPEAGSEGFIEPTHVPALRTLRSAVEGGDDGLARQLLAGLRERTHGDREEALLDSFDRVLTGRAQVDRLELRLVLAPRSPGAPGDPSEESSSSWDGEARILQLLVSVSDGAPVTLHLPPADLEHAQQTIDLHGVEANDFGRTLVDPFHGLRVVPGAQMRLDLGLVPAPPLGRALAARRLWRLTARSGEIQVGEEFYPAAHLPTTTLESVVLAPALEAEGASSPVAFVQAVGRVLSGAGEVEGAALLRLALRLPQEERGELLVALATSFEAQPWTSGLPSPELLGRAGALLAPSLRWLSRSSEPGTDLGAWKQWLERFAQRERWRRSGEAPSGGLDLPLSLTQSTSPR